MQIRKTVNSGEAVVQGSGDTNTEVANLLANKPTLKSVTLTYEGDEEFETKLYERVSDDMSDDADDDEG